jgi:hypothetical protein
MRTAALTALFTILLAPCMAARQPAPIEEPRIENPQPQRVQDLPPPPGRLLEIPKGIAEDRVPPEGPAKLSKQQVMRSVLGFVILLVLAYLAGHPKLTALEDRLHVGASTMTGFMFVLLGLLAATGSVQVLTSAVIQAVGPVVPFCLGWYGFRHGFGYDRELLLKPPAGTGVLASAFFPSILALGGAVAVVAANAPDMLADRAVWRDLMVFGLACGTTALAPVQRIERLMAGRIPKGRLEGFVKMEHLAAIALLMLLAVYFRPEGVLVGWQLPESAWLFIVFGLGSSAGILAWSLFRATPAGPPFIVILLGSIALCSGMASFLRIAVVPVCFIAGLIVAGLPGSSRDQVRAVLDRMQRPILFVLLVIAGALWQPSAWQGWVLLGVFLIARLAGNRLAIGFLGRWMPGELSVEERRALSYTPTGAFSIAIVLSARDLYPDSHVPYTLTAVIMGALLGEFLLQWLFWRRAKTAAEAAP